MTHFIIPMQSVPQNSMGYGIRAKSTFVYDTNKSHSPTRVVVWDNTGRPNKMNGQPVQYGKYGKIGGGNGRWLDPQNNATDDMLTVLLSPEATCIDAYGTSTGTPGSGQVYGQQHGEPKMRDGDTATLQYDRHGFGDVQVTLHFPPYSNGHGYATFGIDNVLDVE